MGVPAMQLIGVDAGGTFTDTVVATSDGRLVVGKALSTPGRLEDGVLASLEDAAARLGVEAAQLLADTDILAHGTTAGLNALLTRTGATVGLITTGGFESTLAIAKANKVHGLTDDELQQPTSWVKPPLLVPRRLTRGIDERVDATGEVLVAMRNDEARARLEELAAEGVDSLAIALLWSVANPVHEDALVALAAEVLPDAHLSVSSRLVPRIGEYERTSTVVVDAYVGPLVSSYLARLEDRLRGGGFSGLFVVMRMGGGVLPAAMARQMPVQTLHSGPVGGVAASATVGAELGHTHVITTDVGGTSFDVGLVIEGEVMFSPKPMIERQALAIPVVDVSSIGTGGGSIAWLDDALGVLRVGPKSAGAMPGPACYGRGGTQPTVTDAAVVIGLVDSLGGALELDVRAAREVVEVGIAQPLGLSVEEAADGIVQVACEEMHDLIRRITVQRGHDPTDFSLYAFGGAGPQYAGRYAAGLGVHELVIPALAAEFSAYGAISSDVKVMVERDLLPGDPHLSLDRINHGLAQLEEEARRQLTVTGDVVETLGGGSHAVRSVGLRFYRQIHRIDLPVGPDTLGNHDIDELVASFVKRYERMVGTGTARGDAPIEVVSVSVQLVVPVPDAPLPKRDQRLADPHHQRIAWFGGSSVGCPVYRWSDVGAGQAIAGPAFVESEQSTVVIYPGHVAVVDQFANIRIENP
jgi:N-methylhydantoinase A